MASVDTSVQLAARAANREELAQRAEKLIAQSRSLNAKLSKQLQEREEMMGTAEEGGREHHTNPLHYQHQREALLRLRTQRFMLATCVSMLLLLLFGGVVSGLCAGDDGLCLL
jgi:hypothetical protein